MDKQYLNLQIKSFDEVEGEQGTFTAIANQKWVVDRARDCTIDGCFNWNKDRLPKFLLQHDYKQVCGVWLELYEDEVGLKVKGQLAMNTTIGRETYELLKLGALDSLSIGYVVNKERFDPQTNINYLEDITIHEVSLVTFECNQGSLVEDIKSDELKLQYKSIEEQPEAEQEEEQEPKTEIPAEPVENDALNNSTTEKETISDDVLRKLDELVLNIKLSRLL